MQLLSVSVHACCCVHVRIVRAYLSVYLYSISQYCKCVSVYMWACAQHSNTRLSFDCCRVCVCVCVCVCCVRVVSVLQTQPRVPLTAHNLAVSAVSRREDISCRRAFNLTRASPPPLPPPPPPPPLALASDREEETAHVSLLCSTSSDSQEETA